MEAFQENSSLQQDVEICKDSIPQLFSDLGVNRENDVDDFDQCVGVREGSEISGETQHDTLRRVPSFSSLNTLKQQAELLLNDLDRRAIVTNQLYSHLDPLKKWYQKQDSHWSYVAKWYGPSSIFMKIGLVLLITALGAGLGAIGNISLAIAIVGFVVAVLIGYLLHNHHSASIKHEACFDKEVVTFEKSLRDSVAHLQLLEKEYSKVLRAVIILLIQQADDIVAFAEQIKLLTAQNAELLGIVEKIHVSENELSAHVSSLGEVSTQITGEVSSYLQLLSTIYKDYRSESTRYESMLAAVEEQRATENACIVAWGGVSAAHESILVHSQQTLTNSRNFVDEYYRQESRVVNLFEDNSSLQKFRVI